MPLINCEVNLILTWSKDFVITNSTGKGKFAITETKLYVRIVTLSTQDNAKLLQQFKSGFKRTINWNKYESKIKTFAQNRYLNHYKMIAIDLSKQQALDADPRAIQQINFTANLDRVGNTTMFFIIKEAKETVLDFSQGTVKDF